MRAMRGLVRLAFVLMLTAASALPAIPAEQPEIPPFPNLVLHPLDGSAPVELESLRGRPVLLSFWASWCGPCRVELPELSKLTAELQDEQLALVTVNVDTVPRAASMFLERYQLDIPVYRVSQQELVQLGVRSLPTNILLRPDGRPAQIYEGYSPSVSKDIRRLVVSMSSGDADSSAGESP